MIDLTKNYKTKCGFEVVLYDDIVNNTVFGRYLDTDFNRWIPDNWNVLTGKNCSSITKNWDLVEIVKFKISSLNCKDVWYHGYYIRIPEWGKWIVTNSFGEIWCHANKPDLDRCYDRGWVNTGKTFRVTENVQFVGDWRDSLNEVF